MRSLTKLAIFGAAAYGGYRLVKKYNLVEKAVELAEELKERGVDMLGKLVVPAPRKPADPPSPFPTANPFEQEEVNR